MGGWVEGEGSLNSMRSSIFHSDRPGSGPPLTIGDHSFSGGLEKVRIGLAKELRGAPKIFNGRKKKRKKG